MRDRDKEHEREQDSFDSNHLRDERRRIGRGRLKEMELKQRSMEQELIN
jgi:hypothetical protein